MVQKGIDKRKEEDLVKGKHCDGIYHSVSSSVVLQHSVRRIRTMMGFSQWMNTSESSKNTE